VILVLPEIGDAGIDMTHPPITAQQVVEDFFGDAGLLAAQIGSSEGLVELGGGASQTFQRVTDLPSLRRFLRGYHAQILNPLELPAICAAHGHAGHFEVRELIELDRRLAREPLLQAFATASQRVGKAQLKRLRDQRLVQRYLRAVQAGEAHGWHTVVYGLILSLYSLPLRQGLLSYAQQTTRGFIYSAARGLALAESECLGLFDELFADFPAAINAAVASSTSPRALIG
jgi:urease accessory protein UreF